MTKKSTRDDLGKLLTVAEVAERLDVPEPYVRRLMAERRLAFIKFGDGRTARVKISEADLQAFLEAGRVEATGASA